MNAYVVDGSELLRSTTDESIRPKDPTPRSSNPTASEMTASERMGASEFASPQCYFVFELALERVSAFPLNGRQPR